VPHGVACAALLAPVIEANVAALRAAGPPDHPALARYTEAAALLTGEPAATVEDGVAWVRQTLALLAIPGLGTFGLAPEQAGSIAAQALRSSSMQGNPVALTDASLREILARAA
jgi:alcohol dehydrogenase class IV